MAEPFVTRGGDAQKRAQDDQVKKKQIAENHKIFFTNMFFYKKETSSTFIEMMKPSKK